MRGSKGKSSVKDWKRTLVKLWAYLSVHKRLLTAVLVMVVISSSLGLLGPYLLGRAIDVYLVPRNSSGLLSFIFLIAGSYLLYSLSTWLQSYWMIGVAQRTVATMREDLFRQLHKLPISYFTKRQHGELMSRLTNDMDNVSQTLNSSFIQLFSSVLTFIGMLAMMIWLSPWLTLITLSIVPLMYFGMKWITARTGRFFKEQQRNLGDLNGFVEETLSGQRVVKTFSQEKRVIAEFEAKNERLKTAGYWAQTYTGFIPKLMNVLNNMCFAVIAGAGGILALNDMVSIGVIVTFSEYARQFTRPLNDLANQFNTFLSAVAGAERVFEVLEEEEEAGDEQRAVELKTVKGEIEFSGVFFSYEQDVQTLSGIDLRVSPGQTLALVGPTGAGKSTVVQLLSRFYEPSGGQIRVDGQDICRIKRHSLRQHMGFVLQDTFLFQDTIRENIRYGKLEASDEEVEQAARLANAHAFIMKLPKQYDTVLSQDGGGISQGQKQLLSIARAILADPSILILDEATSSIDTITEIKIQEALYRLMKGRTNIVIAHRLNTIRRADQIIVLEDGKIIERGTHESLLRQRGFYHGLYDSKSSRSKKGQLG
ncbi:ABC transporter ATP-binding protein [Paenibacillus abyssi]|uniref:ABC transporter ATP-binding protein YfiC n=1 Tax=Paenibacillus abyssi TaxID=1340531 RepID=A0A917FNF3_9BACL|nr:ABC transporter ATP-binding protein [Paenibacillus abyssi]GGF92821.1 putative ABC transporter ATP-binding protein YfiC [Paenibacillus abyssi]